jgi:hypothetical protein
MKKLALILALSCVLSAHAQTEQDIIRYTEEGMASMRAGKTSPGDFYRELHRRIRLTPSSEYPSKAENLKIIGKRIDICEDVEAGRISPEKADRLMAEQQADWEAAQQAAEASARLRRESAEERQRQAAAQDDAARRALAIQILQQQQQSNRPTQLTPYIPPPRTECTSQRLGNTVQTICR